MQLHCYWMKKDQKNQLSEEYVPGDLLHPY